MCIALGLRASLRSALNASSCVQCSMFNCMHCLNCVYSPGALRLAALGAQCFFLCAVFNCMHCLNCVYRALRLAALGAQCFFLPDHDSRALTTESTRLGSFFLQRQCCSSSQCEQAQRVEFVCAARCASRLTPHASRDVVLTTRFTIWIRSNAKQKCSTALRCSQCSQSRSSRSSRDTTEFESMAVLKTRSIFEAQPYRLRRNQIASTRTVLS